LDYLAIEKIIDLDPDGLYDIVHSNRISMCGVSPTYIMMTAAKELGGTKGEVIEYTNSGYVSGDFDQVVGYLSACIN
ncbi:MAG: AmmeMemoRadiSam system protein B, partial [Candidatus Aminicenantes bacterium]|nr:AmmeMemoRadiSam system protein B [Candidatus Aminicenantes bacterium]